MRRLRLYVETSVWSYVYAEDAPEKQQITQAFFERVAEGRFDIFISQEVLREIGRADPETRQRLADLLKTHRPTLLAVTEEVAALAAAYLEQGALPRGKAEDAMHAATATVYELDALVSWNYRHLVNLRRKELIHATNLRQGYLKPLEIITPMEVLADEG